MSDFSQLLILFVSSVSSIWLTTKPKQVSSCLLHLHVCSFFFSPPLTVNLQQECSSSLSVQSNLFLPIFLLTGLITWRIPTTFLFQSPLIHSLSLPPVSQSFPARQLPFWQNLFSGGWLNAQGLRRISSIRSIQLIPALSQCHIFFICPTFLKIGEIHWLELKPNIQMYSLHKIQV